MKDRRHTTLRDFAAVFAVVVVVVLIIAPFVQRGEQWDDATRDIDVPAMMIEDLDNE